MTRNIQMKTFNTQMLVKFIKDDGLKLMIFFFYENKRGSFDNVIKMDEGFL